MRTKFAFKINQTTDDGVRYTLDIVNHMDKFLEDSGLVFMYNGSDKLEDYTKNDFIGMADSYNIHYDFVVTNFNIINERFNALKNIESYPLSMPLIKGEIKDGVVVIEEIQAIVIMM